MIRSLKRGGRHSNRHVIISPEKSEIENALNDIKAGYVAYKYGPGIFSLFRFIKADLIEGKNSIIYNEKLADPNFIKLTINDWFDKYYKAIADAKDDNDKLTAIVSLCKTLEIAHFFADANQRTIVFVLLNKLLIENGFSPTVVDDPYIFDGYKSKKELVAEVIKGQEYFKECVQKYSQEQRVSVTQNTTLFGKQDHPGKQQDKEQSEPLANESKKGASHS